MKYWYGEILNNLKNRPSKLFSTLIIESKSSNQFATGRIQLKSILNTTLWKARDFPNRIKKGKK